jgi:hypothetical protein
LHFYNIVQGVSHDRNQQVHEDDDDNETSKDEECPDNAAVGSIAITFNIELSQTYKVHFHQHIDNIIWRIKTNVSTILISHINDIEEVCESQQDDHQHNAEGLAVFNDSRH